MKKNYKFLLAVTIMLTAIFTMDAQNYFTGFSTYNNGSGRKLNSITFKKGTTTIATLPINQSTTKGSSIYFDKTSQIIELNPNDILTISFDWTGEWMHNVAYVDWDNNKSFSTSTEKIGANDANANNEMKKPITYTIPTDKVEGEYRMRVMVDWIKGGQTTPTHNPNGYDVEIGINGGSVTDVILKIKKVGTSISNIGEDLIKIIPGSKKLSVSAPEKSAFAVYTVSGTLITNTILSNDYKELELPQGIYVIKITNQYGSFSKKAIVKN